MQKSDATNEIIKGKKRGNKANIHVRGRVARYGSCLLILKCPLYAQVRIHHILGLSPFPPPAAFKIMRCGREFSRFLSRMPPVQRDREGRGEVKATEGTRRPFNKGASGAGRVPGVQGGI